jgi:hypothetical protein
MLNLFVTYSCNIKCDYCFVDGLAKSRPSMLSRQDFERLCLWLEEHKIAALGILGGEPTLHPLLPWMLDRLRGTDTAAVVFTNALYQDDSSHAISSLLASTTSTMVVNYNNPANYVAPLVELRSRNLDALRDAGARLTFSKNFSPGDMAWEYLLDGCRQWGVKRIRYDISRPNQRHDNKYFSIENIQAAAAILRPFVEAAEKCGILTGLDCCLPPCLFKDDDWEYLREHSMKFEAFCHPSLDIQTDLSVSYCMPLASVTIPDVTQTAGEWEMLSALAGQVQALRRERPASCLGCGFFGTSCQGGCLALR